jgi:hypothetical protein
MAITALLMTPHFRVSLLEVSFTSVIFLSVWYKQLAHNSSMFVERKVRYSALFTNLVWWHAGAVSFPLNDVILVQLACPLSDMLTSYFVHIQE